MQNKSIDGLDNFLNKCDEVINSKFILAVSRISEMLSSIAASKPLFELFEIILDGFNYTKFKAAYLVRSKENADRGTLILPESAKDKIALIFCLLMDIEAGEFEFGRFLQTYFYTDGSYFESFSEFCQGVIKPFKNTVSAAAKELCAQQGSAKDALNGLFDGEKYKAAREVLWSAKEAALSERSFSADDRAEICYYLDGFLAAVSNLDLELSKQMLIGLKHISKNITAVLPYYKKMAALFENN